MSLRLLLIVVAIILFVLAALPLGLPVQLEWLGVAALVTAYSLG